MTGVLVRRPCKSCPYRRDVPSGIWAREEYEKLPEYDKETPEQPPKLFFCHQRNGRLCAGWVATHNMAHSLAIRVALIRRLLTHEDVADIVKYHTDVPLFASGREACEHGLRDLDQPGEAARALIEQIERKEARS